MRNRTRRSTNARNRSQKPVARSIRAPAMQPPLLDAQAEGEIEAVVERNGIPVGVVRGLETAGLGRPGTNDPRRCGPEPALACMSRPESNSNCASNHGA